MNLSLPGDAPTISALVLEKIGSFSITNTMTSSLFGDAVLIILCLVAAKFTVRNPGKFQLIIEGFLLGVSSFIEQIIGDKKAAWRVMPLVTTLILFILVSNLVLFFVPILSGFTYNGMTMFRSHTSDINTTAALAFGMVFLSHVYSIHATNVVTHLGKYIQFRHVILSFFKGIKKGIMASVEAFVGILDLISEVSKILSLSLRLFGNMFAGELLVSVLMGMLAIGLPLPMMILSLFSGTIQAIVFGALVAGTLGSIAKEELHKQNKFT
ncbi:MAG: FoF1 ATP synthase subunit a [Candidatus Dojkabacteria bacterium]|nr:MAG: FoF1 ATP synthase subunit a [Candidatus Dojkabacteria bacterium]